MFIRELNQNDAIHMYEWMHDISVVKHLNRDFSSYSLIDCRSFIDDNIRNYSLLDKDKKYVNFAITNIDNDYLGTVSLKSINRENMSAEFAIVVTKKAQGTGIASHAFNEIIKYAFDVLSLKYIYFYCNKYNLKANKFYNKTNAEKVELDNLLKILNISIASFNKISNFNDLLWYVVKK